MSTDTRADESAAAATLANRLPDLQLRSRHHSRRPEDQQVQRPRAYALSARAQRLPAHRPCQVDLPELRHRRRVRRQVQSALRRHQPREGRAGVRRFDHGGRALAGLRLGRPAVLRLRLLRAAVRVGRGADQGGQGLRLRSDRRRSRASIAARSPSRARKAPIAIAPSKRTSICSSA